MLPKLEVMQEQSFPKAAESTAFRVLLALGLSHLLNDTLQSVITAVYPLLKESMALSFVQIGFITLVYQISASVFQPLVGFYLDKKPNPWFLPIGMSFTLIGLVVLAFSGTLHQVLFSVFLVGIGSSILHPEASRLTSLASGGKRGLAQSVFQVGGNMGSSLGPLLAALCIAPYGQRNIVFFALLALCAIIVMIPICRWYKRKLKALRLNKDGMKTEASITSYYTFFLIEKFDVTVRDSQFFLFAFLFASALGILLGGPVGDKVGRKYVIWASILGAAPFSLIMPHANLLWTCILSILIGLILSSAFSAILVYAQELLPSKLGLISGLFFGLAFGIAGIASAVLGGLADKFGIEYVYQLCAYMPLLGLIAWFLPDIRKIKK